MDLKNALQGRYQRALEKMYPRLATFSDLNWEEVAEEYFALRPSLSSDLQEVLCDFPSYLETKAMEGDCPSYLFELAYFELAEFHAQSSPENFPTAKGVHLNPTTNFLNFEFDIARMVREAEKGEVNVYERPHVMCVSRHQDGSLRFTELNQRELDLLLTLEDGPQENRGQFNQKLLDQGVIIEIV